VSLFGGPQPCLDIFEASVELPTAFLIRCKPLLHLFVALFKEIEEPLLHLFGVLVVEVIAVQVRLLKTEAA
jgi:hypothetical protein